VLLVTADKELRLPTEDELPNFMSRPDVAAMVAAVEDSIEKDEGVDS
jgi:hypothetical protein